MSSIDDFTLSLINSYIKEETKNKDFEESMIQTLIQDEKYDLIIYALESGFELTVETFLKIKSSGNLKLYQYLSKLGLILDYTFLQVTMKLDQIDTFRWLHRKSQKIKDSDINMMIENGCIEILQEIGLNNLHLDYHRQELAIASGNLNLVQWLNSKISFNSVSNFHIAARHGYLNILQWLWINSGKNLGFHQETYNKASYGGNIETMEWLLYHGNLFTEDSYISAILGDRDQNKSCLEVVKWLWNHKVTGRLDKLIKWTLVYTSNAELLKYFLDRRAELENRSEITKYNHPSGNLCILAVVYGKIKLLQWLIDNGCPYNISDLKSSAKDPKIMVYLLKIKSDYVPQKYL